MTNGVGDTNRSGYYEVGEQPEGRNELTVTDIEKIEAHSQTRNPEATKDGAVTIFEIDAFYAFQQDGTVLSVPENPVVEGEEDKTDTELTINDEATFRIAVSQHINMEYPSMSKERRDVAVARAVQWIEANRDGNFNVTNFNDWKAAVKPDLEANASLGDSPITDAEDDGSAADIQDDGPGADGVYTKGEKSLNGTPFTLEMIAEIEKYSQANLGGGVANQQVTQHEVDEYYASQPPAEAEIPPGDAADITDRFSFRDAVTAYLKANYGNLTGDELTKVENVALDWVAREKNSVFSDANFEAWKAAPETIEYLNKVNDPNAQVGKISDAGATPPVDKAMEDDKLNLKRSVEAFLKEKYGEGYDPANLETIYQSALKYIEENHPGEGYFASFGAWKTFYDKTFTALGEETPETAAATEPAKPAAAAAATEPAAAATEPAAGTGVKPRGRFVGSVNPN